MTSSPIVLVPGFWLGAWAWDEVARLPREDGHDVTALTLPGLDSIDTDRSAITLDGLTEARLETFRRRAVPEPGGVIRSWADMTNDARLDVPSTVIATAYTSQQYRDGAAEGYPWLAGVNELHDITWVDLPTNHWPMWSRPDELAEIIGAIATV